MSKFLRIIVISAIGVICCTFLLYRIHLGAERESKKTFAMATFIESFTSDLRPEQIDTIEEYTLLNALFSPLVIFDNNGRIESNLATRFYWDDPQTLVFAFDRIQSTVDGHAIDADDALVSLKRMILTDKNKHGRLSDRLQIPKAFQNLDDKLESLFVRNNKLYIKTTEKDYFLLHILASADYVIVPRESIDPRTLKIRDFRNTSGPYYLRFEDKFSAILTKNAGHFRLTAKNADEIVCYKYANNIQMAVSDFKSGKIQHIPTSSPLSSSAYIELSKEPGASLHQTRDIMLYFASFTYKARSRFSDLQRFAISQAIQKEIQTSIPKLTKYAVTTEQFFHEGGVGSIPSNILDDLKTEKLKKIHETTIDISNMPIQVEAFPGVIAVFKPMLESIFKNITFIPISKRSERISQSEADIVFASVDVGLKEDFTGISFASEWGIFPLNPVQSRTWLTKIAHEESSHERSKSIEDIHLRSLVNDPTIIQLYRLPVFAISRDSWTMDLPELWVTERLWQIKTD